ncbi:MAG: SLBB domain-containing protein, partial [Alphaproteobacteria bacterium]
MLLTQDVGVYAQSVDGSGNGLSIPNLDINAITNRLQQDGGSFSNTNQFPESQPTILRPNLPYYYPLQQSELEDYYSRRAGADLKQFGYDSFGRPATVTAQQMGGLQDTYIVGVGDRINVSIIGQQNNLLTARVDREGNLQIPKLPPFPAAGRRLADVRADIEARLKTAYLATQVFVSIGAVRQISVLVSGEVLAPGAINISALNSPIDAILLAGGVKKTGSLRQVKIIRGDQTIPVDLYAALTSSTNKLDTSLSDGDKIIVPPLNETVAITGNVPRPGIFEMSPGATSISLDSLLSLGGGYARGGTPRLSVLRTSSNGAQVLEAVKARGIVLHRGDILFVAPQSTAEHGRVALSGQVRNPGIFDLSRAPTLRALLGSPDMYEEQPYMVFAAISRRDPQTLARIIVPFAPAQVLQGTFDVPLQDDDIVRVFSVPEVRVLAAQLRNEERGRNVESRDLRLTQRGAPSLGAPGSERSGTVGAALAGQSGMPNGASAVNPSASLAGANSQISNVNSAPVQTSVLPQQSTSQELAQSGLLPPGVTLTPAQAAAAASYLGQANSSASGASSPLSALTPTASEPSNPLPGNGAAGAAGATGLQGLPIYAPQTQKPAYDARQQPFSRNNLAFDLSDPAVRSQLANYRVTLLGAVQVTGDYLAAPGVGLDSLVEAAGGLTITADLTSIEVTSTIYDQETGQANTTRTSFSAAPSQLGKIALHSRDVVRFRDVYSDRDGGQVVLRGQVRFPGSFDILR